jgi:hypothetical protein
MERATSRRRVMSQRWGRRSVILTPSEEVRQGVGGLRSEVENDARNERDRRLGETFFFDDAVDVSQVIAKCVTGVGCSLLKVTGEVQLCAQPPAGPDCFRSLPLPPKKFSGRLQVTPRHFSDLTKTQPPSSAKTTSLACPSIRPSRQKSVTIEAFVFDENAQVAVVREKRWCAIQGSNL